VTASLSLRTRDERFFAFERHCQVGKYDIVASNDGVGVGCFSTVFEDLAVVVLVALCAKGRVAGCLNYAPDLRDFTF
jgi:hypothetical protein